MNALEKAGTAIGVVVFIFGLGVGWNSVSARFDKVEEQVKRLDEEKGTSLCLAVLSRQIAAIEKEKTSVQNQLQDLAQQHCPNARSTNGGIVVAAHRPATAKEIEEMRAAELKARKEVYKKLGQIDRELSCGELRAVGRAPVRAGETGYSDLVDRDADGVGCE